MNDNSGRDKRMGTWFGNGRDRRRRKRHFTSVVEDSISERHPLVLTTGHDHAVTRPPPSGLATVNPLVLMPVRGDGTPDVDQSPHRSRKTHPQSDTGTEDYIVFLFTFRGQLRTLTLSPNAQRPYCPDDSSQRKVYREPDLHPPLETSPPTIRRGASTLSLRQRAEPNLFSTDGPAAHRPPSPPTEPAYN